jgi:pyridoxal phosphate enzyme (YggS family)
MLVNSVCFCSNGDRIGRQTRLLVIVHILLKHLMFSIADNLENVRQLIKKASVEHGRALNTVDLLPVSKTQSAEVLFEAIQQGVCCFGENYLNEALAKQDALKMLCNEDQWRTLQWHFIGPVQSNKTRLIAERFDWVQSVDRAKVVKRLNEQRPESLAPLNICIQLNIDNEESKSGITLAELSDLASQVSVAENLCLRGLMVIPKAGQSEAELGESFQRARRAYTELQQCYETVDTLSMGMSADMALAVEHGSTMVRVGTAIFGKRT